jgi:cytochrome c biogenesis protein CcmG/thiol:disulfide interchange protein DsbE
MKLRFILPLILFAGILSLLWRGLSLHPAQIPSPLINKPVPEFSLPTLSDKTLTDKNFKGHVTLLNVWATWCAACAQEHTFLLELAKRKDIELYGLDYKDDPSDAKDWLKTYGNPYKIVANDQLGRAAMDWGVYGTPETFVIDKKGLIRYKLIGALTEDSWEKELKPIVEKLQGEAV